MKSACFIPVKANSERVRGKNFREIGGLPIYQAIVNKATQAECFDDVFVDTNSSEVAEYAKLRGASVIERKAELAENTANGNDLIVHHFLSYPNYGLYFQLFATAPLMSIQTMTTCCTRLIETTEHDSIFTAIARNGFFWWNGQPVNYLPNVLPRSQDLVPVMEETTGLYGITANALDRLRCRIGAKPMVEEVSELEAIDLNTEDDFHYANWLVERGLASVSM